MRRRVRRLPIPVLSKLGGLCQDGLPGLHPNAILPESKVLNGMVLKELARVWFMVDEVFMESLILQDPRSGWFLDTPYVYIYYILYI